MNDEAPTPLRTILVPLDRSERAERALPVAERLAAAFGSTLLLVQVSEPVATAWDFPGQAVAPHVYNELARIEDELRTEYLERVASEVRGRGLNVATHGMRGSPAPMLLDYAEAERVDLIVMASHGYGGVERFAFGSVTDRLLRHGKAPVLVVRPWGDEKRYLSLSRAIVPLDGSATAEVALSMAKLLAGDPLHKVTLLRVVDPDMPSGESEAARSYLHTVRERLTAELEGHGCAADDLVLYGRVADQILDRANDEYDLVILATHGRTGAARWALGSVADRVLRGAHTPLLLVHARAES